MERGWSVNGACQSHDHLLPAMPALPLDPLLSKFSADPSASAVSAVARVLPLRKQLGGQVRPGVVSVLW
jgi:hypothetical protein